MIVYSLSIFVSVLYCTVLYSIIFVKIIMNIIHDNALSASYAVFGARIGLVSFVISARYIVRLRKLREPEEYLSILHFTRRAVQCKFSCLLTMYPQGILAAILLTLCCSLDPVRSKHVQFSCPDSHAYSVAISISDDVEFCERYTSKYTVIVCILMFIMML